MDVGRWGSWCKVTGYENKFIEASQSAGTEMPKRLQSLNLSTWKLQAAFIQLCSNSHHYCDGTMTRYQTGCNLIWLNFAQSVHFPSLDSTYFRVPCLEVTKYTETVILCQYTHPIYEALNISSKTVFQFYLIILRSILNTKLLINTNSIW